MSGPQYKNYINFTGYIQAVLYVQSKNLESDLSGQFKYKSSHDHIFAKILRTIDINYIFKLLHIC